MQRGANPPSSGSSPASRGIIRPRSSPLPRWSRCSRRLFGAGAWSEWIRRALIFLVISCPCALVLSIPLTFFAGLAITSKAGVLFKGADALERLPQIKAAVLDKTGTPDRG